MMDISKARINKALNEVRWVTTMLNYLQPTLLCDREASTRLQDCIDRLRYLYAFLEKPLKQQKGKKDV